jgi:hypothetical protein
MRVFGIQLTHFGVDELQKSLIDERQTIELRGLV